MGYSQSVTTLVMGYFQSVNFLSVDEVVMGDRIDHSLHFPVDGVLIYEYTKPIRMTTQASSGPPFLLREHNLLWEHILL